MSAFKYDLSGPYTVDSSGRVAKSTLQFAPDRVLIWVLSAPSERNDMLIWEATNYPIFTRR